MVSALYAHGGKRKGATNSRGAKLLFRHCLLALASRAGFQRKVRIDESVLLARFREPLKVALRLALLVSVIR